LLFDWCFFFSCLLLRSAAAVLGEMLRDDLEQIFDPLLVQTVLAALDNQEDLNG